jgi:hypothetical protein
MPSLHVGWAAIVGYGLFRMWTGPRRLLGVVHALLTTIAVVVTANHYWLDIVVALAMVAAAVALVRWRAGRERAWDQVVGPAGIAAD